MRPNSKKGEITRLEYFWDIVGLRAKGNLPVFFLNTGIITKTMVEAHWGWRKTGYAKKSHGGYPI
jgi:hypothetical protein